MELTNEDLNALRKLSTPTVANAVEAFNIRPRNQGHMSPEVRCLFPDLGVMTGYAVTMRFAANQPPASEASRFESWKYILEVPEPRVVVLQDMDSPPGAGAPFGEVMATIHQRLGCVGAVTNGHMRDLDEARALGFHFFAGGVCVSHAYVHLIDFGQPVTVGGLTVRSGDLIHGDKHGVMVVPKEHARAIPGVAAQQTAREQYILSHCKDPNFSLEELYRRFES